MSDSLTMRKVVDNLERDLKNRINDVGIPVFSTDKDTDIKEIQEHIEAVDKILSWY